MNAFHRGACAAAVVLCLACANTARAQTFYTTDTTIQSDVAGDVVVGHSSNSANFTKSSPNVTLSSSVSIGHDVQVFNSSTFTTNGNVGGSLSAYDYSIVTVGGGTLAYALFADNNSTVNINGGTFSNVIDAFNNSRLNVRGGDFRNLYAFDSSVINFIGNVTVSLSNPSFGYQGAYNQYTLSGTLGGTNILPNTFLNIVKGSGATYTINGSSISDITPVPEPGSVALLMGLGVTGAGFAAKRRRQRA